MSNTPGAGYVELRCHSSFSFGEGAVSPETLAIRAAQLGYTQLGLTDCADLGGVVRFVLECQRQCIKPIVGVELVVDGHPAAFLVRDAQGYRNVAALITRARSGQISEWSRDDAGRVAGAPRRGRPHVRWHDIVEHNAGLIALTGPSSGSIATSLRSDKRMEAARTLNAWREVFGDRLAIEVQLHHAGRDEEVLAGALVALAERHGVRWVVTNDPRYVDESSRLVHNVLVALRHDCTLDEATDRGLLLPNDAWTLRSASEMATQWSGREAGLEASVEIAEMCDFNLAWMRPPLPDFPVQQGRTIKEWLHECVMTGAIERWGVLSADSTAEQRAQDVRQQKQLAHELDVIGRLGFDGFFLTMWDAVREARRRGILCQGRGSAANSAVAYCLGITAVDPVLHGLLFERFLSEARTDGMTEAPDIDLDIEHDRREELLDYMYKRYGRAHAAITGVTQQYSASTAVQDTFRAYGIPLEQMHALSKRVHRYEPARGAELLRDGLAAAHGLDVTTPRGEAMLRTIAAFEGLPRLRSTHPGGFVLSSEPLGNYCPVEPTTMGRTILQFDKDDLDTLGIPKFDFLGLGALSMVRRAFDAIEQRTGVRPEIYRLPPDDPKTFEMISRGDTMGMFQIESRAQISSLVQTRPEFMYDIVVQVALIRPGPIVGKFVHPYTNRRRGREAVRYPGGLEELLAPILKRTQGIPIFQEQAMAISVVLGGYTAAEADGLRRTMGHARKQARLTAALEKLRASMVARGIPDDVAAQIADDMRIFGNYGFPESHAWSFALIAYATAYLKAHHPTEFLLGLLNAQPMGFYSVASLVHDAQHHGVEVRLPCLAHGFAQCTTEETTDPTMPALRLGWRFARGISANTLDALTAAAVHGPFQSVIDVVKRAGLNASDAATLARAHAFAAWEPDRRRAVWEGRRAAGDKLPLAPARPDTSGDDNTSDRTTGFSPRPLSVHDSVTADYHALGLSTAGHPTQRYRAWLKRIGAIDSAQLQQCRGGEMVIVAGLVTVRQRPSTAKGVMFLLLEDELGAVNVVVWRTLDEKYGETIRHSKFLAVYGKAERDGPLVALLAKKFKALDNLDDATALTYRSHNFR